MFFVLQPELDSSSVSPVSAKRAKTNDQVSEEVSYKEVHLTFFFQHLKQHRFYCATKIVLGDSHCLIFIILVCHFALKSIFITDIYILLH